MSGKNCITLTIVGLQKDAGDVEFKSFLNVGVVVLTKTQFGLSLLNFIFNCSMLISDAIVSITLTLNFCLRIEAISTIVNGGNTVPNKFDSCSHRPSFIICFLKGGLKTHASI